MKALHKLLALAVFALFLTSCSKDSNYQDNIADLTATINPNIQEQDAQATFDNNERGLYRGIIASGDNQSRGQIWINMGNDGQFNAQVELVSGEKITMQLIQESSVAVASNKIYTFVNDSNSVVVDLSNFNEPSILSAQLGDDPYLATIVKDKSNINISVMTGTFFEDGNPSFNGTWNLIADGSKNNPNSMGGAGITASMITFNGNMFNDTDFNTFDFTCVNDETFEPVIIDFGERNVLAGNQTTTLPNGTVVEWELLYDTVRYVNADCGVGETGTFTWTNAPGTVVRTGFIHVD